MMRAAPIGPMTQVDFSHMPAGASGYTMVSTFSGGHMCTRTTEYSSAENGQPPKILTKTSGSCDNAAAPKGAPSAVSTAPTLPGPAAHGDGMTQVRYDGGRPAPAARD